MGVAMPASESGAVMTPGMMRVIREQRIGFVATLGAEGVPNLSPKGTFAAPPPARPHSWRG